MGHITSHMHLNFLRGARAVTGQATCVLRQSGYMMYTLEMIDQVHCVQESNPTHTSVLNRGQARKLVTGVVHGALPL